MRHSLDWRRTAGVILASVALAGPAHAAPADPARERMEAIVDARDGTVDDILAQLAALRGELPATAAYPLQRDLLRHMRRLQVDSGHFADADRSNEALRALARKAGDAEGVLDARLHDLYMLDKQQHLDQARAVVAEVDGAWPASASPILLLRRDVAYGRFYISTGDHDKAAARFMDALRLAQALPERAGPETQAVLVQLMHVYTNMKDYGRALATCDEAMAVPVPHVEPRILAGIWYGRGQALVQLKREREADAAFQKALAISRKAGLTVMETFILGNLADAYLSAQNWAAAETTARQALALAERIGDTNASRIARANLGLALGGQGKLAQAIPWIDAAAAEFRAAGADQDMESLLEEKSRMLERAGRYRDALGVVRDQQVLQKQIFTADRVHAIAGLQQKFGDDAKRRQIELLTHSNELKDADIRQRQLRQLATTVIGVMSAALAICAWLLYRRSGRANRALQALNDRLAYQSTHDPLTGLYNRRSFVDRMRDRAVMPPDRRGNGHDAGEGLIVLDVDHFKVVNDTWGHAGGDTVLVEVARRLQAAVRESDMVLRWGGEEFVVAGTGLGHVQLAALVERILHAVGGTPIGFEGVAIPVTISAGFAALAPGGLVDAGFGWEKAVAVADAALYLAKRGGRNCARGVDCAPPGAVAALEAGLNAACDAGAVQLVTVAGPSAGDGE